MSNPVLQSEQFESAAYSLKHAIENWRIDSFTEAVQRFEIAVDRMCQAIEKLETMSKGTP